MKTLLITGASGVLGKKFIQRNTKDYKIIEAKRETKNPNEIKLESWVMDVPKEEIDAVIHFAGKYLVDESIESKRDVHDSIIGTAAAVAKYCSETNTPLIALGSYFEKAPVELQPWSYYSSAKIAAYNILKLSALNNNFALRYVYCYDTFGEDISRRKIVDVLLDPNTTHLELSEGNQKMNLTYVDDFVEGLSILTKDFIANPVQIEEFQIKSDLNEFTLKEIAEKINSARGKKIILRFGAKPYRNREVFSVWECAPPIPNFNAKITLDAFIEEYLGSYNV